MSDHPYYFWGMAIYTVVFLLFVFALVIIRKDR